MSIRKPQTRAVRAESNGQRLLQAARAVFVRRGYQAATLDEIAAAAGLTKGAVYARFAGKADLLLALLAQRIAQRLAELRALPAPRSPAEAVDGIFRQWLERSRDAAWNLLVVEFRVVAARDKTLNARYRALHESVVDGVAERIVMGAAAAGCTLRRPAPQVARIGLAFANGLLLERAVAGEDELPEAFAIACNQALIDSVTDALLPVTAPARRKARR
jgi:AcrR family transcriptional regulator